MDEVQVVRCACPPDMSLGRIRKGPHPVLLPGRAGYLEATRNGVGPEHGAMRIRKHASDQSVLTGRPSSLVHMWEQPGTRATAM